MMRLFIYIFFIVIFSFKLNAEIINKIEIEGNNRISNSNIILFGKIELNENYDNNKINRTLKNLYETDFFEKINISIKNNILIVKVQENPIIQSIEITGVKNKTVLGVLTDNLSLKEKNPFVENKVRRDEIKLKNILKINGYYFSKIKSKVKNNENNTVDLKYEISLGEKAYISSIKFIGDKQIKDRKLKNIIVSEENKFWKFISNKKFVDSNRIKLDEKLLLNYYKNNGYYNAKVYSSYAQLIDSNNFELVFNINAGEKFKFNNISIDIPKGFSKDNFVEIQKTIDKLKDKTYSINRIDKILKEIDKIVIQKQFEFVNASYSEITGRDTIDLKIKLTESKKEYVEKINIFGNYITNENVIRNEIISDEGDPYNEILFKKSINKIKSRNIFKTVQTKVKEGSSDQLKIIDVIVEEKPTGEISAGAGTGTSGSSISFSIAENNYLGKGSKVNLSATLSDDSLEGKFRISEPNFKNSDKTLNTTIESSRNDLMSKFGYETNETGFSFGTTFEQYQDIFFSPEISMYYESLTTSSKASNAKKKQEGDYFDTNFSYSLNLNKLNQNFQPTDGYRSTFSQSLPILADDKSISNAYEYANYTKLRNETVFSFIFFAKSINNFDDDVRISKRIFIPSRKLRGFAAGKIGPKDSDDFIGGNYGTAMNLAATLPNFMKDLENIDFSLFLDTANVWGVDYNSSLDSNKIRSSTGIAVDWFTPIGPLSFSLASPITKSSTDETETFRFRIGTTF